MSRSDLESLPPDLERLLESEKSRPDPPSDMRSRVLERIGDDLLNIVPPSVPPGQSGPPAGAAPSGTAPPTALLSLRHLPVALSLVALGGAGGAALHASLEKAAPAPITLAAPSVAAPGPTVPAAPPAGTIAAPVFEPPAKVEARRESPSSGRAASRVLPTAAAAVATSLPAPEAPGESARQLARDAALAAERALLEQARSALARGKPGDAMGVLYRHERDFAHGQLVEEREALEILCLAADRQTAAARGRADKFRQKFPKSMLLRAIDDALATAQ